MNKMVDYRCSECGHEFENFFHSDAPDMQPCPVTECHGSARRYPSMPGEYRPTNAKRFDPIVIWQSDSDPNKFSFPGRSDEPCDAGYHRIEITDMRSAQKWSKKLNHIYSMEKAMDVERDRAIWSERLRSNRADREAKIRGDARMEAFNRAMIERTDKKRQNRYDHKSPDVNFHIQALEFDQSNRQDWCDKDTGWKARRD